MGEDSLIGCGCSADSGDIPHQSTSECVKRSSKCSPSVPAVGTHSAPPRRRPVRPIPLRMVTLRITGMAPWDWGGAGRGGRETHWRGAAPPQGIQQRRPLLHLNRNLLRAQNSSPFPAPRSGAHRVQRLLAEGPHVGAVGEVQGRGRGGGARGVIGEDLVGFLWEIRGGCGRIRADWI